MSSMTEKMTKKKEAMCIMQIEDNESSASIVIFPKMWQELKGKITAGTACIFEGRPDDREQVILNSLVTVDDLEEKAQRYVKIIFDVTASENLNMKEFFKALGQGKGSTKIILEFRNAEEEQRVALGGLYLPIEKLRENLSGNFPVSFEAA
mgnify:CR=1 FL=1